MWNIEETIKRRTVQLHEWRSRYSQREYPSKVIRNLFYELYGTQFIWDAHCDEFFSGNARYSDFKDAIHMVINLRNKLMIEDLNPRLDSVLKSAGPVCAGIEFGSFEQMIEDAQDGDNGEVAEIELSFIYYVASNELVVPWFSFGLLGKSKHDAFKQVTGGDIGGFSMDSYDEAIRNLSTFTGMFFDSSFEKLPPLW